jgi:hypothetical protein
MRAASSASQPHVEHELITNQHQSKMWREPSNRMPSNEMPSYGRLSKGLPRNDLLCNGMPINRMLSNELPRALVRTQKLNDPSSPQIEGKI